MAERDPKAALAEDVAIARNRMFRRLLIGAIAAVVVVLLGLPLVSMLQPKYYQRYPDLHVRMENWRSSTHARIPCSGCHVDPGAGGLLAFWGKSIPAFYSQLLHGPRPTNLLSTPDRTACRKCHTSYRKVSAGGDLLIPHKAHVEVVGVNCPVCHKDLVHTANTQGYNQPKMSTCLTLCHDGDRATDKCVKCHTRKQVPDSHRRPEWLGIHSTMTEKINCGQCHAWSPDYCRKCHLKRPKSHAGNWKKLHRFRAEARGTKGCGFCHNGLKSCKNCHD